MDGMSVPLREKGAELLNFMHIFSIRKIAIFCEMNKQMLILD